jgi:hypothetical protein
MVVPHNNMKWIEKSRSVGIQRGDFLTEDDVLDRHNDVKNRWRAMADHRPASVERQSCAKHATTLLTLRGAISATRSIVRIQCIRIRDRFLREQRQQ